MSRNRIITFDKQVNEYLNRQVDVLKELGIKNVSRADALRVIIEQNKAANLKMKRKPKSKFGFNIQ